MIMQAVTWLSLIFSITALLMIQNDRQAIGWTINIFNQGLWMTCGIMTGYKAFIASSMIYFCVNVRGLRKELKKRDRHAHDRRRHGGMWPHDVNVLHWVRNRVRKGDR